MRSAPNLTTGIMDLQPELRQTLTVGRPFG